MKLTEIINGTKPSLSFEVFPPKHSSAFESVKSAVEEIAALKPSYISVTYGAGGGTSEYTVAISSQILKEFSVTPLAHLSCISSTRQQVREQLLQLRANGIENVLALRGGYSCRRQCCVRRVSVCIGADSGNCVLRRLLHRRSLLS